MSDRVGLVVLVKNGDSLQLASTRLHDDASIGEAVGHARDLIILNPGAFRTSTELVVGEVRVRKVRNGNP
jgi:hypothetical protein